MKFSTPVAIPAYPFRIEPMERVLFVGSCFAGNIGQRFKDDRFDTLINPFGTMYNPASVLHTVEKVIETSIPDTQNPIIENREPNIDTPRPIKTAFITLGTNHVYRLIETGEIVDNCQKRPQRLFTEEELSVEECVEYLAKAVETLRNFCPDVNIIFTVSPIRYAKYGYHESQLSKATLLLAIDKLLKDNSKPAANNLKLITHNSKLHYFPAYEIVNDELRDYRFYAPDMLHPSEQAADYIYEKLQDAMFSDRAKAFIKEWRPILAAKNHRPFNPDSDEYKRFLTDTLAKERQLISSYM